MGVRFIQSSEKGFLFPGRVAKLNHFPIIRYPCCWVSRFRDFDAQDLGISIFRYVDISGFLYFEISGHPDRGISWCSHFSICRFRGLEIPRFLDFETCGVADCDVSRVQDTGRDMPIFRDLDISGFRCFEVSGSRPRAASVSISRDSEAPRFEISRFLYSGMGTLYISDISIFRYFDICAFWNSDVSIFWDFAVSKFRYFAISMFRDPRFRYCAISRFRAFDADGPIFRDFGISAPSMSGDEISRGPLRFRYF